MEATDSNKTVLTTNCLVLLPAAYFDLQSPLIVKRFRVLAEILAASNTLGASDSAAEWHVDDIKTRGIVLCKYFCHTGNAVAIYLMWYWLCCIFHPASLFKNVFATCAFFGASVLRAPMNYASDTKGVNSTKYAIMAWLDLECHR